MPSSASSNPVPSRCSARAPREAKPLGELLRLAFLPPGCRIASRASQVRRASREDDDLHNRSYRHQVINGFLELIDTVSREEGVIVIGACNHPDRIDPAVLRAGRFDLKIEVPLPDTAAILGILRRSLGDGFGEEELRDLARMATGSSAVEVDAGVRKARALARAERRALRLDDLRAQFSAGDTADTAWA